MPQGRSQKAMPNAVGGEKGIRKYFFKFLRKLLKIIENLQ